VRKGVLEVVEEDAESGGERRMLDDQHCQRRPGLDRIFHAEEHDPLVDDDELERKLLDEASLLTCTDEAAHALDVLGIVEDRAGCSGRRPLMEGLREQGIRLKFNPLSEVAGKRVVLVDDSIVRGNTTRRIVKLLFEAGAQEVHVRISAPPIVSPCFYGIDFADEDELVAARRSVEAVRSYIGASSLHYLSLEGLTEATRRPESELCRACLTRDYPTRVPVETAKLRFEPV
jgi:hypothetical protein